MSLFADAELLKQKAKHRATDGPSPAEPARKLLASTDQDFREPKPDPTGPTPHHHELPAPVPGEDPTVAGARQLLQQTEPDPTRQLLAIRRVLEQAEIAPPKLAIQILRLLIPFGADYPGVANVIASRLSRFEAPTPRRDPAPAPTDAPVIEENALKLSFDWTVLLAHGKSGTNAPGTVTPEQHAKLVAIAANRPALLDAQLQRLGSRLDARQWKPYGGGHGWGYAGNANAAPVPAQKDRILDLAVKELFTGKSVEAYVNSVVTYDGTLSIGSGWANNNAAEFVRRWLASDPEVRAALVEAGFSVTADGQFAAVDDSGNILVGGEAFSFLRAQKNGKILDYLSGLMEQKSSAPLAMDAGISMVKSTIVDRLEKNGVAQAMSTWSDEAVQAAIHLGNWDFAGGPAANPNDFKATGGSPLKIVQAFAKNMAPWIKQPNGALLFGGSGNTAKPLSGHMERWAGGVLATAVRSTVRLNMTLAEAGEDSTLAGHVLVVEGDVFPGSKERVWIWDTGPA
ncbi:MAG: hypothetical protein ABI678_00635 [Kofleriaceae bacterium]